VPFSDESVSDAHLRRVAVDYIKGHVSRLPVVVAARVGREFGFYVPFRQLHREARDANRPIGPATVGLFMYYALVVGALYGARVLRRRGVTLVPFGALLVEVVATAMLTVGATRYRVPLEVALVILSAVAVDRLLERRRRVGGTVGAQSAGAPASVSGPPAT